MSYIDFCKKLGMMMSSDIREKQMQAALAPLIDLRDSLPPLPENTSLDQETLDTIFDNPHLDNEYHEYPEAYEYEEFQIEQYEEWLRGF